MKVTDPVFADDAVLLMESLQVLLLALKMLHDKVKSLRLMVSWTRARVQ